MRKHRVRRHEVNQPLDKPYRLIPLTQGQNAIVDERLFNVLSQWNWCAHWSPETKTFYAEMSVRSGKFCKTIKMHRLISRCDESQDCDHKNFDTLDNRKENLRPCTEGQNATHQRRRKNNTSGYKGVQYIKKYCKWGVYIRKDGKQKWVGQFDSADEAARAYDAAALENYGEFAHLNFPIAPSV